jgi:galactokinase/mevalonate kinase-like predicted kinase
MIQSSAPGRCGILGNPTDGYGGTVLSASLAERATVRLTPLATREAQLSICGHEARLLPEDEPRLTGGFTDVAVAVLSRYPAVWERGGFRLEADTTVPVQAGLAGSTTMLIAILGAVLRLIGRDLHPYALAETARELEFNAMGVTCGFHDQYLAVFGGLCCVDFRGKGPLPGEPVTVHERYATVEPLTHFVPDLPLLLAGTGVSRVSGSVHTPLRERWLAGDPAVVAGYERCAELAREGKAALLARDWAAFGTLMNENHAIQRDLGGSGEANERLIAAALAAGALGAKLAGAGKGGTIIALHEDRDYLAARLQEAGAARVLPVRPGEGLRVTGEWE